MSHSEFSDRLSEYLERELADREHDRFSAHLAECADCAGELRELEGTVRLLRGLPEPELPPAFARTVIARVRAEAEREGLGERVRRWLTPMRKPGAAVQPVE